MGKLLYNNLCIEDIEREKRVAIKINKKYKSKERNKWFLYLFSFVSSIGVGISMLSCPFQTLKTGNGWFNGGIGVDF